MTPPARDLHRAWSLRMSDPALAAQVAAPWAQEAGHAVLRAYALWAAGDPDGALETLEQAEPDLRAAGEELWRARALGLRGDVLIGLGQPQEALDCFQAQLALAQEVGDLEMQGMAHNDTGVILIWNDPQRARQRFQLAYDLFATAPHEQANWGLAAFNLSVAYWELGERDLSDRYLAEAQERVRAARAWPYWAGVVSQRAQRLGEAGETALARQLFREADTLDMPPESRDHLRFFEAKTETLHGDAARGLALLEALRPWTLRRQDMLDDYLDVLARAQRRLGDPAAAYDTMRELLAAVQARHAREQATQLRRLEAQHRAEEAQRAVSHLSRLHQEAQSLNLRDELTGLSNRRGLLEWRQARPPGEVFTLAFLDIDRFKGINDRHGHQQGDEVIRTVAELLLGAARPGDLCARLGGDEFVFARWTADVAQVAAQMERVAEQCRAAPWPVGLHVSLSIGVAGGRGPTETQLDAADRQMYRAKQAGGARVYAAPGPDPVP
ncbi:diguanylate cyclase [uncultured Deinococcus sp.]|uniref:diguanylate cyclase n=1 Tax=uncultured Deinococcus sp. TaxID=158789 RepID=UPI002583B570|nr:diguanylate cyclase [uncultured Deinococcus sp.]